MGDKSNDQQAALDQIMAEIASRKGVDKAETRNGAAPADFPERSEETPEADDDQQAALDKIMAEIQTRKGVDKVATTSSDDPGDDELPQDQEAALNKIMAEIQNRKTGDRSAAVESPNHPEGQTDDLSGDQQAVLQSIMAEIGSRRNLAEKDPAPAEESENLTLDQFSDELDQLLNSTRTAQSAEPADKVRAAPQPESAAQQPLPGVTPPGDTPSSPASADAEPTAEVPQAPAPTPSAAAPPAAAKPRATKRTRWRPLFVSILLAVLLGGSAYHFRHQLMKIELRRVPVEINVATSPSLPSPAGEQGLPGNPFANTPIPNEPNGDSLNTLIRELQTAHAQIEAKIGEIEELMAYYRRGVTEEQLQIKAELEKQGISTLDMALQQTKIDLTLRTIQRQMVYSAKLEIPLANLRHASEELLYQERRTRFLKTLADATSGLPVRDFIQEVSAVIKSHLQRVDRLTVDDIDVASPTLETIWKEVLALLKQGPALAGGPPADPHNDAIAEEFCQGSFERKYQLTALSAKSARCLLKWSGKDLYLNEVRHLSPETAAILSQWPGEWLSLNGLRELSPESARQLAKWPGKRLSLNGLTRLSAEATQQLSRWQGEQMELIGLRSIGRWENYVTRLYLSEEMRRRLEVQ
jgi:hypothetical protein